MTDANSWTLRGVTRTARGNVRVAVYRHVPPFNPENCTFEVNPVGMQIVYGNTMMALAEVQRALDELFENDPMQLALHVTPNEDQARVVAAIMARS